METNTDFNVISLNVRGLRSLDKRRGIFLWLTKQKADIVFLQETYSTFKMKISGKRNGRAGCYLRMAPITVKVP